MSIAGYILAGGKNTRMNGQKKLFLTYDDKTFLTHITKALEDIRPLYLSVDEVKPYEDMGYLCMVDLIPSIGPMGGIYTGLSLCDEETLLVVPCDTPKITKDIVSKLISRYNEHKCLVVVSQGGRLHPLIGIYPKHILPIIKTMINKGNYRMMSLLDRVGFETVELLEEDSELIMNINDPKAYKTLQEKKYR